MKIFLVNLDKNKERLAFMDAQLKRLGLEYERIPAVYGKELSPAERRERFSPFHSYLAWGKKLTAGEIGCSLSHDEFYRIIRERGLPGALVLEDDVILTPEFPDVLERVERFAVKGRPQVVLLSSHNIENKKSNGIDRICSGMCTDGYYITSEAAAIVLKANYPVITAADSWNRWSKRYGVELYRAWPTTVVQDNVKFGTDVNTGKKIKLSGMGWVVHKGMRAIEKSIDWLWFLWAGR